MRVVVVTGHSHAKLSDHLSSSIPGVQVVYNGDFEQGMLTSVRVGLLSAVPEDMGAVVALGDMPFIEPASVEALVKALADEEGGIYVPSYKGKRGHPIGFSRKSFEPVLTNFDEVGLRGLTETFSEATAQFEVSDKGVLCDIDNEEDYLKFGRFFGYF